MLFLSARRRLRPVALLSTLALAGGAAVAALPVLASPAQAAPTELFFSEYVEGTSNNKALEIYNGTGAAADLAAGGYNVAMFFNGATTAGLTINLTGTVAAGDVFVLAQSTASAAILAQADQTNGSGWFNGDDAIVLRKGTTVVDSIGQIGFDPGTEWGTGLASTADNTLRRTTSVTAGDTNPGDVFDPSVGWDGFATDTFDGLGAHSTTTADAAPAVSSTTPTNGATEQSVVSNVTVRFSEPVATSAAAFALSCTSTGAHGVAVAGGPQSWTVNPTTNLGYGESCTLTVSAAGVSDVDADDPPDAMVADFTTSFGTVSQNPCSQSSTPVYEIQGDTDDSPKQGQALVTSGVVSAVLPDLSGFSLQDPTGDGNEATSDGVFVFLPSANPVASLLPTLAPGDSVTLAGTPKEFQGQTEIDNVTALEECSDPVGAPAARHRAPAGDGQRRARALRGHAGHASRTP